MLRAGFICYVLLRVFTGTPRRPHPLMVVIAEAFVRYFAVGPIRAALACGDAGRIVRYAHRMSAELASGSLTSRLRLAVVRLNRRLRSQRTAATLSLTQLSALAMLYKCGELTPGALAGRENVQPPSMTRVIAGLERAGYVRRKPHPTDGRQALVELTGLGEQYVSEDIMAREAWLGVQLAELNDEERDVLDRAARIIERIAET
jgi:DNA-binding MarR family transcriptional regulator